jgi:hypothetical protein
LPPPLPKASPPTSQHNAAPGRITGQKETTMKTSSTGMRTSEGWLTLIAMLYSALVAAGLIPHSQEISAAYAATVQAISAVAALLAAFGYAGLRTWLKAKHVENGADDGAPSADPS